MNSFWNRTIFWRTNEIHFPYTYANRQWTLKPLNVTIQKSVEWSTKYVPDIFTIRVFNKKKHASYKFKHLSALYNIKRVVFSKSILKEHSILLIFFRLSRLYTNKIRFFAHLSKSRKCGNTRKSRARGRRDTSSNPSHNS